MCRKSSLTILFLILVPLISYADKGGGGKDGQDEKTDESRISALEESLAELDSRLGTLLAGISRETDASTGKDTIRFSGMNVQIVNGQGSTSDTDGTGNLIIGYNELREGNDNYRDGSHMLVIGAFNNYTDGSYGGMAVGAQNETSAPFASVTGGTYNLASGWASSVSGGDHNLAAGNYAAVSGGNNNAADGDFSAVNGGSANMANGFYGLVSGGVGNTASGWGASVSGGNTNTASWYYASVSGGNQNTASGYAASVSGGDTKDAVSSYCWEAVDEVDC